MKKTCVILFIALAFATQTNAADKNAKIKQVASKIVSNFSKIDSNGDNKLSEEELKSKIPEKKAKALKQILSQVDSDGDGQISKEELEKAAK